MNNKYNGSILLTTLLFLFLFSFIFQLVLKDFQLTQRFSKKTRDYYIAKTMVSMFLHDVKQEKGRLEKVGQQKYSTGMLYYEYDQTTLKFTLNLRQTTYKFQENYPKVGDNKISIQ